ncbi:MAG: hypothetical protein GQ534_08690, partial [Candidatus Delongbacteria bacterium]|nr:hypothetical protein [Candidatus Delongbacteria bacterium]
MNKIKYLFLLIFLLTNLSYSYTNAYVTVEGAGAMDGSSWGNALPADSIQVALWGNGVFWNSEVWIAEGVYKPTIIIEESTDDREKFFRVRCNKLYGGFAGNETDLSQRNIKENETIFSGDIGIEGDNSDNCYNVIVTTAPVDGITIQDGNANGYGYDANGGGAYVTDYDQTFRNCTFRNNYASDRGGAYAALESYDSRIVFENCLFYDNESAKGGAIYANGNSLILTNCTIVNNTADEGGGLYLEYISQKFTNNIIWNNTPNQIFKHDAFGTYYSFNAIEDGYDGFENKELNTKNEGFKNSPYFTDPSNNNWTLQPLSPCIDSGVFWNTLDIDITNMPAPKGECRDMGAYEYDNGDLTTVLPTILNGGATVTSTTAILRGNITDNGGTQIVAKGIKYSETSGFDPETEGTLIRSIGLFDEEEFEILAPNLVPETTYYYRAYCENKIDGSYATDEQSFTTLDTLDINPDVNGRIYVKVDGTGDGSSWANALNGNELQNGLDANSVEEIWVAKGKYIPTNWPWNYLKHKLDKSDFVYKFIDYDKSEGKYNGTTEREKHFALKPNRKLYGGFDGTETTLDQRDIRANETILSGDIGTEGYAQDNAYHVIYHYLEPNIDSNSVIDGFTISDGYADGAIWDDSYFGGGIFNRCSSPTISNCVIKNNYAVWGG